MLTELPIHRFSGYTMRMAMLSDNARAQIWAEADPDHAWEASQRGYWIEQAKGINSYVLESPADEMLCFVKLIRCQVDGAEYSVHPLGDGVEINLQFDRTQYENGMISPAARRGLIVGFDWLEKVLAANGITHVYFNSKNQKLIDFCVRQFGFAADEANTGPQTGHSYVKAVPPLPPPTARSAREGNRRL